MSRFRVSNTNDLLYLRSKYSNDCFYLTSVAPWVISGVASGTHLVGTGSAKHPGTIQMKSTTGANSGYRYSTDIKSILLNGGEKTTVIFKTAPVLTTVTTYMGFHDSVSEAAPTDGVYSKISNVTLTGQTINNTTGSTTGSSFTVSADTWYRLVIEINADATLATFVLYADDSDTVLWTDTLATNIPKTGGREVGHTIISTSSGVEAIVVGELDYMDMVLPYERKVV